MSPSLRGITAALLLLPLLLTVAGIGSQDWSLPAVSLLLFLIYGVVWFWFRPSYFLLSPNYLEIVFPAWKRQLPLRDIFAICLTDGDTFRREFGWAVRIGAGGLWGGFGWLWTSRRGLLEFYISRLDGFVLIERRRGKPLLITPSHPEQLVAGIREVLS